MKLLERLDRLVRPIAIPNLTMVIIILQVVVFFAGAGEDLANENSVNMRASLIWSKVMEGQVWRLITFIMIPPATSPIFLLFALYIFHLMGTALEQTWGLVRYNVFFYLGYLLTLLAAAISPFQPATGTFLQGSVFLAFATYHPNFELRLFFILPVKIKWLAYLQAIGYGITIIAGPLPLKLMTIAALGNYLIFFTPVVLQRAKNKKRQMEWSSKQKKINSDQPRHACAICEINSNTNPEMDFRYCSKCGGDFAYCSEHLRNHEHKQSTPG